MMVEKLTLFLDDVRDPPSSLEGEVVVARTYEEAVALWEKYKDSITHLSLDHDLGEPVSGYDFILFLISNLMNSAQSINEIPDLTVHSMNPVGKKNMEQAWAWLIKRTQEGG